MTDSKSSTAHILIADDEVEIRLNLVDILEMEGYQVTQACNGTEVLDAIPSAKPDLILTDLMMPEKTGLEVLEAMTAEDIRIPVVIMTAFGTIDYAVKAMKLGAADFMTKPVDYDYMFTIIRRVLRSIELERKVEEQQRQMKEDLALAGTIQRSLLPNPIDNQHLIFQYRYEPLIDIGGDHISVHPFDDEHIYVALFDVTGHGVSASIVANMVHNQLINLLRQELPPPDVVEQLSQFLIRSIGETRMFLTMILCDIDAARKTMTVCNAGHPVLMICRAKDSQIEHVRSHTPPVGFLETLQGENLESTIQLDSGDRIVLYTDGFPEAENEDKQQLTTSGFEEIVQANMRLGINDFIDEIYASVNAFQKGDPEDDWTLAMVEMK